MSSSTPASVKKVSYHRRRHQNRSVGTGRSVTFLDSQEPMFNHREDLSSSSLPRSLSDLWKLEAKLGIAQTTRQKTSEDLGVSMAAPTTFDSNSTVSDHLKSPNNSEGLSISESGKGNGSINADRDEDGEMGTKPGRADPVPRTYYDLSEVSLPPSAASYYSDHGHGAKLHDLIGPGPCTSVDKLNQYLHARKMELKAGVPGKFLHAIIGQEGGSVVSTIMYAFYLDETQKSNHLCTLPVINMKRADLNMHSELKWLLGSCHVDQSSLVFIDEINLPYYDLFGSLKLVLLNGHNLLSKQEGLKDAVVEVFNCKQDEYSEFSRVESVTTAEGCSSCALIAGKFAKTSPETLGGCGFSRLLLAGILLDTANLTSAQCTLEEKHMATLLLRGAGRFGCNGFYQILKYKMFDISDLKVWDILRRDLKQWTRVAEKPGRSGSRQTVPMTGMSTIGFSIHQLLAHEGSAAQEIALFLKSEKLHLLLIVSGYYDRWKTFKREMLVATDTPELMGGFLHFFNANGKDLPLKPLQLDLGEELRAFKIDNKTTSRSRIERLLEEFSSTLRQTWRMLPDLQTTDTSNLM